MDYGKKPEDTLFVEAQLTPLSEAEAAYYLREAYCSIYSEYPSQDSLAILWAQTALETGRWKSIWNNNWGNIKKLDGKSYTSFKCSEVLGGKNTWFFPYHPQTFFAAWDSHLAGATAYLVFLSQRTRYAKAWQEIKNGNPQAYCAELKAAGYFTADLQGYTKGVVNLTNEFKDKSVRLLGWKPSEAPIPITLPDVDLDFHPEQEATKNIIVPSTNLLEFLAAIIRGIFNHG